MYEGARRAGTRTLRWLASQATSPTRLRYREMTPNYASYAVADADAINSIDCFEAKLWFRSRGDVVLEGGPVSSEIANGCRGAVLIQLRKTTTER